MYNRNNIVKLYLFQTEPSYWSMLAQEPAKKSTNTEWIGQLS